VNKIIYQTESQVGRKEVLPDKWDTGVVFVTQKGCLNVMYNLYRSIAPECCLYSSQIFYILFPYTE
jgi:hypothetical protein